MHFSSVHRRKQRDPGIPEMKTFPLIFSAFLKCVLNYSCISPHFVTLCTASLFDNFNPHDNQFLKSIRTRNMLNHPQVDET